MARTTAAATAAGSPANGGTGSPAVIAVLTKPGLTQSTRTPLSRSSTWSASLKVRAKALVALYTAMPPLP